jgi:effector-binding domain-containing protein
MNLMITEPIIEHRDELHYLAIRQTVAMQAIPSQLPPLLPKLEHWFDTHHLAAAGPPFFRYLAMDQNNVLEVEVGYPVAAPVATNGEVSNGYFPAGTYAVSTYKGDYKNLKEAHGSLEKWLKDNGWQEDFQVVEGGTKLGVRTEFYMTDPAVVTDPGQWITEIALLVKK